jgi:hemolysin-activating ACP:hemolysin acyltransferase
MPTRPTVNNESDLDTANRDTDSGGAGTPETRPAATATRSDLGEWQTVPGDKAILTAWRPTSPAASLGLAAEYLSTKPAFAKLSFGDWSQVLFHQVVRGHYLFVVNQDRRVCGFLGWALTDQHLAELWVEGRSGLKNDECLAGDSVIVNAWAADTTVVNRFLLGAMRKLFADRRAIYFKRHYPDGRERPMRLMVPGYLKG